VDQDSKISSVTLKIKQLDVLLLTGNIIRLFYWVTANILLAVTGLGFQATVLIAREDVLSGEE
jgi:hypothetical protein